MNPINYQFTRSLFSPEGKIILINSVVVTCIGIISFIKHTDIKDLLVAVFGIGIMMLYFLEPSKVVLNENGFCLKDTTIKWESVKNVAFKVQSFKGLGKQIIEIELSNPQNLITIRPRLYQDSKGLRNHFEDFVDKHAITKMVEDRGFS